MAKSVTEIIDAFKEMLASSKTVEEAEEKFTAWSGAIDLVADSAGKAGKKLKEMTEGFSIPTPQFLKDMGPLLTEVKDKLRLAGYDAKALTAAMVAIGPGVITGLRPFESLGKISEEAGKLTMQASTLATKLKEAGLLKGPLKWAADVAKAGDAARNMENQLIMNMSAAGHMDDLLFGMGETFSGLNSKVLQFSNLTADIGTRTGLSAEQVAKLGGEFMKLPDLFDAQVKGGKGAADQYHILEAAIKVARGTGQSYVDVQKDIIQMTQEFGATAQRAVETISRMHSATQILGLNLKDMRSFVADTGEQFKFFGDNASSAVEIMTKFAPALLESGLGPAAVKDIVQGFTRGIADMTVAQTAFLAGQAGVGGGGLRGGLQIEEMLAGGEVGKVAEMIEGALRELGGGRLITRKEAAAGPPGMAAQFEFQRQLLQQGPFGKLAGSKEEAAKLLEALSAGRRGVLEKKIKGGPEALQETMDVGTRLAERGNTELVMANNKLAKIANFQSIIAKDATKAAASAALTAAGMTGLVRNMERTQVSLSQIKMAPTTEEKRKLAPTGPTAAEEAGGIAETVGVLVSRAVGVSGFAGEVMPTERGGAVPPKPGKREPEKREPTALPLPPERGGAVPPKPAIPTISVIPVELGAVPPTVPPPPAGAAPPPVSELPAGAAVGQIPGQPKAGEKIPPIVPEIVIKIVTDDNRTLELITMKLKDLEDSNVFEVHVGSGGLA